MQIKKRVNGRKIVVTPKITQRGRLPIVSRNNNLITTEHKIPWFKSDKIPKVSVIIPLNKNKSRAIEQIKNWNEDVEVEFIYINDKCPENPLDVIMNWKDKGVGKFLVNNRYAGFAKSCNIAVNHAKGEYLLFLDPSFIPTSHFLQPLLDVISSDVGMVIPKYANHSSGSKWENDTFIPIKTNDIQEVEMVSGNCFLIKRDLFLKLEGFDTSYPRWNSLDLAMNLKKRGLKILAQPNSKVNYIGGDILDSVNKSLFHKRWIAPKNKPKLTILTPSIREHNLPILLKYIKEYHMNLFDLKWLIVMDYEEDKKLPQFEEEWIEVIRFTDVNSKKGIGQYNYGIDQIKDGYIWGTADDNIPHPNFFLRLSQIMNQTPNKGIYIVAQRRPDGKILHAREGNIRPGYIDGAQAVVRRDIYGDRRFKIDECADGIMYQELFKQYRKEFYFVDEVLSYFECFPKE